MFWVACPCWMWFLDASHCLRQCWYCYMVTFMTFNSWGLRQEARSADMEVPVLTLLSKQLQGELQFARYRQAHFTPGWQGKVTKFRKCSIYYTDQIYVYSRTRNIVLRAFWNCWRRNQFEISSWMCASNIPKFSSSEPHDNVGHPNSLFLPFGSFVSLLLLEPQALCQLPVVDNLLQMPDLQVLQAQYRWWVCLGPGLFRIDDGTWRLICRAQIRIWAFYLGMHTSVHNFIHMGGCDAERQGSASFINQQVMQRMSRTAISNAVVASKDVIFLAGAEAKAAYFTQHLARTNRWLHAFSVESAEICWTQVQKHSLSRACMCNTVCKECTLLLIGRGAGHWRIFTMPDKNQQLGNMTRVSKA